MSTTITAPITLETVTITAPITIGGVGSGAAAWGTITGTLSAQTDLQTALNAKQATLTNYSTISALTGYPSTFPPITTGLALLGGNNTFTGNITAVDITGTGVGVFGSLSLETALPVSSGGTGATTTSAARTALLVPASDPAGITGADAVSNIVSLTQAEYDAIGTKNASTLYVIV